jgi:hypothetical protein
MGLVTQLVLAASCAMASVVAGGCPIAQVPEVTTPASCAADQVKECVKSVGLSTGAFNDAGVWGLNEAVPACIPSLGRLQGMDERSCATTVFGDRTTFFIGNSVTRDLMFTIAALLNHSAVHPRDEQAHSCVKSREYGTDGATCRFNRTGVSDSCNCELRMGWFHWFARKG